MMMRPPSIKHLVGPKFCAKCFPDMDLNPHNSQLFKERCHYPHFTDEETVSEK